MSFRPKRSVVEKSLSLERILQSRDERARRQRELLAGYPGKTLICFTVIPPGAVKRSDGSLAVAAAGRAALHDAFSAADVSSPEVAVRIRRHWLPKREGAHEVGRIGVAELPSPELFEESRDLETGFEMYMVVDIPAEEVKLICCDIEDTHPLGRLMDIDVITEMRQDGALAEPSPRPMTRAEVGLQERRCLICERPARECIRARRHTAGELLARYNEILKR